MHVPSFLLPLETPVKTMQHFFFFSASVVSTTISFFKENYVKSVSILDNNSLTVQKDLDISWGFRTLPLWEHHVTRNNGSFSNLPYYKFPL